MSLQAEKAVEELKEGEKKLAHTNKLILIADSAGEDWGVVDGYERRDLADDSKPYFPEVVLSSAFVRYVQQLCGCPFS